MSISIRLNDSRVMWSSNESSETRLTVWGRGYALIGQSYCESEKFLHEIVRRCEQSTPSEQINTFKRLIPMLDGCWALVMQACDGIVLAAVDRSRSIPLFYAQTSEGYILTDTPDNIHDKNPNFEIDPVSAAEFLLSGYVSGSETLYKGIYKVQPGELVEFRIDGSTATHVQHRYFQYFPKDQSRKSWDELEEELEQILETTFARIAVFLKGKQVVLPLSGGYDSRLIAWMLKKYGIENVLCYTYGVSANPQRVIAEQVAQTLGFEWRFIEYNAERWAKCMSGSKMSGYWDYASRGVSSPHLQDFPAVFELASEFRSGDHPVFLPGHVGDAWACEFAVRRLNEEYPHPPSEYHSQYNNILDSSVVSAIVYRHLNLWPIAPRMWAVEPWISVARKIDDEVRGYENQRESDIWRFIEWVLRNRTALWIVNSCRCFEYFGALFMLPLGTNEIIDFFRRLPMEYLLNRGLYAATLKNRIFGKENPLHTIPVMSGAIGSLQKHNAKPAIIKLLSGMGLFKPIDKLRRRYREPRNLYAESWFAQGHRPERISICDGLKSFQVEHYLPAELVQVIRPLIHKPLYSIQCNGLLTAVVLAKQYEQFKGSVAFSS